MSSGGLRLLDIFRERDEREQRLKAAIALLPQLPNPPTDELLPCGEVFEFKDLRVVALPYTDVPADLATDIKWRMHARPGRSSAKAASDAMASFLLRCLGDVNMDTQSQDDCSRLKHHLRSREIFNLFLDESGRVSLIQDGYVHNRLHLAPAALAAWRLRQRGFGYTYETYINNKLDNFDADSWYSWNNTIHVHRDIVDVIRVPYSLPPPPIKYRSNLASRFCRAAIRLGISPDMWWKYPILEYLRELSSSTPPSRPYTKAEKRCVSEFSRVCKVHPLHVAAHCAVWTLWSSTWSWPPWRVCARILSALRVHHSQLPGTVLENVIEYLGGQLMEDLFLDTKNPFDVENLDGWDWWWDVWHTPARSLPTPAADTSWELPDTPQVCISSPDSDMVIQPVEHSEPAAHRDSDLAALQADQEWAEHVQHTIAANTNDEASEEQRQRRVSPDSQCGDAQSAPASSLPRQCLLPSTMVRIPGEAGGCMFASELAEGMHVQGGAGEDRIRFVRLHDNRNRDIACIKFIDNRTDSEGTLTVTSSQYLPVLKPSAQRFLPLPAADVSANDVIRTHLGEASVINTGYDVQSTKAVEVEFEDSCSSMFVADPGVQPVFVQVYGELTPPPEDDHVKILCFRRCTRFHKTLLQGEMLRACRNDLERNGFFSDLTRYELGPGKMFVSPSLANRTLEALRHRKKFLNASEVVVSRSFEAAVLDAALHVPGARPNYVLGREPLDLCRSTTLWITSAPVKCDDEVTIAVERTFLNLLPPLPPDARSVVTVSTTDARPNGRNPRVVSERAWW